MDKTHNWLNKPQIETQIEAQVEAKKVKSKESNAKSNDEDAAAKTASKVVKGKRELPDPLPRYNFKRFTSSHSNLRSIAYIVMYSTKVTHSL